MFKFKSDYFFTAMFLLVVEALIAAYVHDSFIRPVGGDFLVVILLYCLFASFMNLSHLRLAIAVLLLAYAMEILQYFHFINRIGLQDSLAAKLILGNFFQWADMLAYTLGMILVVIIEQYRLKRKVKQ